jgi:dihydroorotate dehydrogenase electron transfer subunit
MKATVLSNQEIAEGYHQLQLFLSTPIVTTQAGQFFMIRSVSGWDPLLPRPFSVYRQPTPTQIEFLYKRVGRGTLLLSQCQPGEILSIHGPMGNGFPLLKWRESEEILLVGGGVGVPPLIMLAEALKGMKGEKGITAFVGGRGSGDILGLSDLASLRIPTAIATEDGSQGFRGYVTDALEQHLQAIPERPRTLYACGPHSMLKAVARIVRERDIPAYFSLEAVMACGIGICMGCAERGIDGGYPLVCQQGPVFRAEEIRW